MVSVAMRRSVARCRLAERSHDVEEDTPHVSGGAQS